MIWRTIRLIALAVIETRLAIRQSFGWIKRLGFTLLYGRDMRMDMHKADWRMRLCKRYSDWAWRIPDPYSKTWCDKLIEWLTLQTWKYHSTEMYEEYRDSR